jgi:hypothetical protein
MAKKGPFDFLGETLGVTGPANPVASEKKKEKPTGLVGQIMTEIVGPEINNGVKDGVKTLIEDIFHRDIYTPPTPKAKPEPQPVLQTPPPQNERLLTGGASGTPAEPPISRGKKLFNTAVFVVGGGFKIGADVVRGTGRVVRAAQESHRKSVAEKQAKAREGATIIDGEVKE